MDGAVSLNISIDTDPHLQEAALPQVVVVRSFLRYAATSEVGMRVSFGVRGGRHSASPSGFSTPRQRQRYAPAERCLLEAVPFCRVGKPRREPQWPVQASLATLQPQALSVGAAMNLVGKQGGSYHRRGAGSASAPCGSERGLETVRFICSTVAFSAPVHNNLANTDPPLQEAASPQMWWPGCLQR